MLTMARKHRQWHPVRMAFAMIVMMRPRWVTLQELYERMGGEIPDVLALRIYAKHCPNVKASRATKIERGKKRVLILLGIDAVHRGKVKQRGKSWNHAYRKI